MPLDHREKSCKKNILLKEITPAKKAGYSDEMLKTQIAYSELNSFTPFFFYNYLFIRVVKKEQQKGTILDNSVSLIFALETKV